MLSVGPFEDRLWAEVRGHQVDPDGTVRPRERFASIRVDRARVLATDAPGAGASPADAPGGSRAGAPGASRADGSGASRAGAGRVGSAGSAAR
ncbi:hypothetical protein [Micromonospora echinofusca]|uniref:hypothetical protein n=1 Tax=Micromonospora echinofusca TaxID=47858 RepID=UPI00340F86AB